MSYGKPGKFLQGNGMKQQAGIGILWRSHTAMCWGALPIAMKQVLEVMEPPTVVFYRFLMASLALALFWPSKKASSAAYFSQAALAGVAGYCDRRSVR
jgi:drug/metabolite transporter (DMT)-like permease